MGEINEFCFECVDFEMLAGQIWKYSVDNWEYWPRGDIGAGYRFLNHRYS